MIVSWWKQRQLKAALRKKAPDVQIEKDITVIGPLSHLTFGSGIRFAHNVYLHLGGLAWSDFKGSLSIGKRAVLGPSVVIYAAGPFGVHIGDDFDCGPGVKIFASKTRLSNFEVRDFAKVTIGDGVTLFANVVVSPGVTIGNHVVIAANSVVTKDIPSNSFAGGSPAKIIKENSRP